MTDLIIFSVHNYSLGYTQICLRSIQLNECKLQNYRSLLLHVEREENNSWPGPFCFTCAISAYWGCHFLVQTLIPGRFFITHQDYRKPPLSEHGRMRQPHCVLSSNITREEAIPVFDWQGAPCKVCISVLETEYTTFRILQLIHP